MGDGRALQMGTSHELGQYFAWQTSWGSSTRMVGAVIMCHGDEAGLRLPPAIAPVQVTVILVRDGDGASGVAAAIRDELAAAGHRVRLDDRVDVGFGRRSVGWELKGVPVRVEAGPRELAGGSVTVVRRDTREETAVPLAGLAAVVGRLLAEIQRSLDDAAPARRQARTVRVGSVPEAVEAASAGWAVVDCDRAGAEEEDRFAADALSVRCVQASDGSLAVDEDPQRLLAVVGKAY